MAASDDAKTGERADTAQSATNDTRLLLDAMRGLTGARSAEQVAQVVRHAARALVAADGASFVLKEGELCFYLDEDAIAPLWKGQRFPCSACISGWAMQHRQQVAIADVAEDARIPQELYRPTFVRSMVMTPVCSAAPVAAIGTYWAKPHQASARELQLLKDLADAAALALENAEMVRELERRVAARTEELTLANKELEGFAHVVAHDLRSPLSVVLGFATLIKEREVLPKVDPSNDHLAEVLKAGERMEAIISSLLTYSRLTRVMLHPMEVDLTELARDVVQKLSDKHPARRVELDFERNLRAYADPTLATILLTQLLDNAYRHTAKDVSARVELSQVQQGDEPVFCMKDNGCGIDPKHFDRLFLPFQRFEQQREVAGSGIGLATCARIVRRHGGRIWVESEKGKGASFFFTLGRRPPQVAS